MLRFDKDHWIRLYRHSIRFFTKTPGFSSWKLPGGWAPYSLGEFKNHPSASQILVAAPGLLIVNRYEVVWMTADSQTTLLPRRPGSRYLIGKQVGSLFYILERFAQEYYIQALDINTKILGSRKHLEGFIIDADWNIPVWEFAGHHVILDNRGLWTENILRFPKSKISAVTVEPHSITLLQRVSNRVKLWQLDRRWHPIWTVITNTECPYRLHFLNKVVQCQKFTIHQPNTFLCTNFIHLPHHLRNQLECILLVLRKFWYRDLQQLFLTTLIAMTFCTKILSLYNVIQTSEVVS